jgi:tRNA U34 2-thiouridine synthase MnmA/TrmU
MPATLSSVADDTAILHLDERQFGIATGQAAVLYDVTDNDVVLGGGWITDAPTIGIA